MRSKAIGTILVTAAMLASCGGNSAAVKKPIRTSSKAAVTTTTVGASADDLLVRAGLDDVESYWAQAMATVFPGQKYAPIAGGFYSYTSTSKVPPCPGVTKYSDVARNAFYCPKGDLVAWDDEKLIPGMRKQFGDFAIGIVMAHEVGHAIQARVAFQGATVTREQQADCYAGAWVASVWNGYSKKFKVTLNELDAAVAGFLQLRDPIGTDANDKSAHGSAFDRVGAFQDGFINGAKPCSIYTDATVSALLVELPFKSQSDANSGGTLAYDNAVSASFVDLEDFWSTVFAQAGKQWTPLKGTVGVTPELAQRAYKGIGDFAVSTLIGHGYATLVQKVVGEAGTPLQQSLQADCLTGTWAASLFLNDRPHAAFHLSPGDLDEAITALLLQGDSAANVNSGKSTVGTSFMRITAFRTGFLSGIAECAKITESSLK